MVFCGPSTSRSTEDAFSTVLTTLTTRSDIIDDRTASNKRRALSTLIFECLPNNFSCVYASQNGLSFRYCRRKVHTPREETTSANPKKDAIVCQFSRLSLKLLICNNDEQADKSQISKNVLEALLSWTANPAGNEVWDFFKVKSDKPNRYVLVTPFVFTLPNHHLVWRSS